MKTSFVIIFIISWLLFLSSCKKECPIQQDVFLLPIDSVYVNYTGSDTIKFQVTDAAGTILDTFVFHGRGTEHYWSDGPFKIGCREYDGVYGKSENIDYKFVNIEDTSIRLTVNFDAMPEDNWESDVSIYCNEHGGPPNWYVKKHIIACYAKGFTTTINILGTDYYNVKVIYRAQTSQYAQGYFNNTYGILKMIDSDGRIWLKIP